MNCDLQVGDRVTFLADVTKNLGGTFCQFANVDASVVCKLPEVEEVGSPLIDMVEAAALPAAAGTAYIALFDKLRIEKGKSIFISGATGGVGSVAVQLAHFFGLQVFASCSSSNLNYARELGADVVIDYARGDVVKRILKETKDYGVDYLLECASSTLAESHSQALRYGGSICVITGLLQPSCDLVFRRQLSIHYVFTGLMYNIPDARAQLRPLCTALVQMYLQQAFRVDVEEVPLSRVGEALSIIALGHCKGKLVVTGFHEKEAAEEYARRMLVKHYNTALQYH
ncbi:NADPH2:quinone reductase [Strigomonas culicis]|nr:NADPH2:quinone reductase [Strigomonas culicis]|eukprot:EPY24417.1 NADPH2:quinone reductase [Strigomonas culicis]